VPTDESSRKRLGGALFYGIVILLAYFVYRVFEPFLDALAWAAVLVVVCYPVYARLAKRSSAGKTALAATAGVTLILIVPALFVMIAFVQQGVDAVHSIQSGAAAGHFPWVSSLLPRVEQRLPQANPGELWTLLQRYAEEAAAYVAGQLGTLLKHTALFLFELGVTIFAMFYFFRDGPAIIARLQDVLPFEESYRERMLREAQNLIYASVTSSLAGAVANGAVGGLAFALAGIGAPVFWGVTMGLCSFLPVVGSALIWVPGAIVLMAEGHVWRGILLAIICGGEALVMDNFIRPWMISGRTHMNGLMVFISVLGGISVFGLLGIVLGPIVVATAASLLDVYAPHARAGNPASKAGGTQT
jgi:predicted PurR-regulated permease PerM